MEQAVVTMNTEEWAYVSGYWGKVTTMRWIEGFHSAKVLRSGCVSLVEVSVSSVRISFPIPPSLQACTCFHHHPARP